MSISVLRPATASKMMSPPLPPLPPLGPPYSMNFSRRKLPAPGPPAPERTKILAWSRKCISALPGRQDGTIIGEQRVGREYPRRLARQAERLGHRSAEQRIAQRHQHQLQGFFLQGHRRFMVVILG